MTKKKPVRGVIKGNVQAKSLYPKEDSEVAATADININFTDDEALNPSRDIIECVRRSRSVTLRVVRKPRTDGSYRVTVTYPLKDRKLMYVGRARSPACAAN